jgi:anti-anti-sigma factor
MIFINHKEDTDGKIVVVDIKGALDSATSADFEEYINQLLGIRKYYIVLNAEGLEFVSSAGIGVILYIQKKIFSGRGFFILCGISEEISALYEILGFDKIIKIEPTIAEALKTMEKQLMLIESEKAEEQVKQIILPGNVDVPVTGTGKKSGIRVSSEEERSFEHPLILECSSCKGMIRVKKSGNYICPDCKTEFLVEPDQTVIF